MKLLHMLAVFVVSFVTIYARRTGSCPQCGSPSSINSVKLPKGILLSEFDMHWANEEKVGYQAFFGWQQGNDNVWFNSDTSFKNLGNNTYIRKAVGSTSSGGCEKLESGMTPVAGTNKAMFLFGDWMQVFFSSCSSKYLWYVRCIGWVPGQRTCALNKIWMKLIVPTLDRTNTIPWEAVIKDLKRTGLTFGAKTEFTLVFGFGTPPANCSVTTPNLPATGQ